MIALLVGLALADPCGREVVIGRGLQVEGPTSVTGALDLGLWIRKRRVDGIPSWYVRKVKLDWRWLVTADEPTRVWSRVGDGDALCEGEVRDAWEAELAVGTHELEHSVKTAAIEACRVRVVLRGTSPATPVVRLKVHGAEPPGVEGPVDGEVEVVGGQDVVIDVPGCL